MGRSTVSPEIKAAALADLASGEQPAIVAERYGINGPTVRKWKERLDIGDVTPDVTHHVTPDVTHHVTPDVTQEVIRRPAIEAQQLALGELILENLRAKLIATKRIADHVTTPAWLDKQSAADVAELFECLDRSAIRVLDRLAGRAGDESSG